MKQIRKTGGLLLLHILHVSQYSRKCSAVTLLNGLLQKRCNCPHGIYCQFLSELDRASDCAGFLGGDFFACQQRI